MPITPTQLFSTLAHPDLPYAFQRLSRNGEQTVRALTDGLDV